jgi:hypothetical protein
MKARFAVVTLLCACFLSGCVHVAHFYPVQGPLAAQTPPPIYTGKVTGVINSGSISAELANGQQFSGQWQAQSVGALAKESRAGVVPPFNLSAEWARFMAPVSIRLTCWERTCLCGQRLQANRAAHSRWK